MLTKHATCILGTTVISGIIITFFARKQLEKTNNDVDYNNHLPNHGIIERLKTHGLTDSEILNVVTKTCHLCEKYDIAKCAKLDELNCVVTRNISSDEMKQYYKTNKFEWSDTKNNKIYATPSVCLSQIIHNSIFITRYERQIASTSIHDAVALKKFHDEFHADYALNIVKPKRFIMDSPKNLQGVTSAVSEYKKNQIYRCVLPIYGTMYYYSVDGKTRTHFEDKQVIAELEKIYEMETTQ